MAGVSSAESIGTEGISPTIPPSSEVRSAMATDQVSQPVALLAIEEIMRTDPNALFDWPSGQGVPTPGVTYTPPTGDD